MVSAFKLCFDCEFGAKCMIRKEWHPELEEALAEWHPKPKEALADDNN
jgi:hypothetical protein